MHGIKATRKAGLVEMATKYLFQTSGGGTADEFARWAGYDNVFYAKHGLDILRHVRKAIMRDGVYFPVFEPVAQNPSAKKTDEELRDERREEIVAYLREHPEGVTIRGYADVTGLPKDTLCEDFRALKIQGEIKTGFVWRYFHRDVEPVYADIRASSAQYRSPHVELRQSTKAKVELTDDKLVRVLDYVHGGRLTTMHELITRLDLPRSIISKIIGNGYIAGTATGYIAITETGKRKRGELMQNFTSS